MEYVSQWDRPLTQAPCHRRWQAAWNDPRSVVIGPTGFGKTTQALYRVLWEVGRDPSIEVDLVGKTQTHRRGRWLARQVTDNPLLKEVFGAQKWSLKSVRTRELVAASTCPTTNADLVVIEDCGSINAYDRVMVQAWLAEMEEQLKPGARLMVLGCPYTKDDVLFHLAAKPGWTAEHEDAIEEREDGTEASLDPNIMTMAEIRRMELDLGPRMAAALLRCRPIE